MRMTVGYVLDDSLDRADGVQQAILAIGEHMRSLGHDVHYIVTETERTDIQNVHAIGGYLSMQFNGNSVRTPKPVSMRKIHALFAEVSFDVLHVQMPYSPFLAGRVLRVAPDSVRKIGTFHILPYNAFSSLGARALGVVLRRSIRQLDVAYAVSEPARVFMERSFGVRGSVLPNPINYDFYHDARPQENIAKTHIVFVGRFEERKGVRELVRAYSALGRSLRKDTHMTMVGKGPLLNSLRKQSADFGLDITFPGFVSEEEKATYLSSADIAVFPSISGESFGIVLTEAMAAGAGVTLGGNNPGYSSILHMWPETLFSPRDTSAFAAKLEQFIKDTRLRKSIGKKQRINVKQYDIKLVCQRLIEEAYTD